MNLFLTLAFLFFIGSVAGWVLELLYRNFRKPLGRWVNPGFCTGPYVPLYGFGLCALFLIASLENLHLIENPTANKLVLFLGMAVCMTVLEYLAGILCLDVFKVRLWDYSKLWGNIRGIICPLFSLIWAALGAVYYFLIHPYILEALRWLSGNLAFSFVIGLFFGVFLVDLAHSAHLTVRLKAFAERNDVVVAYERIKENIRARSEAVKGKYHFFRPFHSEASLSEALKDLRESFESRIRKE